jgi:hypothetical protein
VNRVRRGHVTLRYVELGPAPECEDEGDDGVDLDELQRMADSGDELAQWALAVAAQIHQGGEDPDADDGAPAPASGDIWALEDAPVSGDGWTRWRPGSA